MIDLTEVTFVPKTETVKAPVGVNEITVEGFALQYDEETMTLSIRESDNAEEGLTYPEYEIFMEQAGDVLMSKLSQYKDDFTFEVARYTKARNSFIPFTVVERGTFVFH